MARRFVSDTTRSTISSVAAVPVAIVGAEVWIALEDVPRPGLAETFVPYYLAYWPVFTVVYLAWTHLAYRRQDEHALAATSRSESESRRLWWNRFLANGDASSFTLLAALFAVILTISIVQVPAVRASTTAIVLGLATVASSWALMVYAFALDYLRLDASLRASGAPHLEFHAESGPRFGDYLTFAVLASTMAATISADVPSRAVWRKVRANVLMAFAFNSVVVAMMVSLLFGGLAA